MRIRTFDANYGRSGIIEIRTDNCLKCRRKKRILFIDQSEEEYYPAKICKDCILKAFEEDN